MVSGKLKNLSFIYHLPLTFYHYKKMLILGIESSCDETAAAVVRDGTRILSSVISSQIELHKPFGGVVPDIASREHLEKIDPIVKEALAEAKVSLEKSMPSPLRKGRDSLAHCLSACVMRRL